jgi:hypothetical protein
MSEEITPYRVTPSLPATYYSLKGADALAHLSEVLSGEVERFEKETSFKVTSVRTKREKETELLQRLIVQVR